MATVTTLWRGNSTTICNTTEHAEARTTCQNPVWDPGTSGRLQSPLLARMSWPGLPKPQWGMAEQTATEAIELIRQMAVRYSDEEIARVLNRQGQRTGKGNRWSKNRVAAARRRSVINGHRRPHPDPEVLSLQQAARYCEVSSTTMKRLVASGLLDRNQVAPWAPWEIKRAD